uniref:Uncharacterized protein n=2 Tax=Agaricomycotina TaxID=5302 RepID=A0A2H4QBD7_9TREE|nr:hypothetical protein [Tremella fuciformis]YP_010180106.1 hypothetical protein LI453_mgp06 [Auricularia auricula-judae]ATX61896.1 hypothetical protein [Tremella fuciformis]ATX61916.1 hypothetical protein [Tremella fuciformis]ATX61938.1 hypothetical protein [Tremella fuciformis]ATX62004.1 hypothetical protein [Tremella fuciformis]ATX62074.1 hypothetical protein [Tremella fuciformis]
MTFFTIFKHGLQLFVSSPFPSTLITLVVAAICVHTRFIGVKPRTSFIKGLAIVSAVLMLFYVLLFYVAYDKFPGILWVAAKLSVLVYKMQVSYLAYAFIIHGLCFVLGVENQLSLHCKETLHLLFKASMEDKSLIFMFLAYALLWFILHILIRLDGVTFTINLSHTFRDGSVNGYRLIIAILLRLIYYYVRKK